jgi:signal transduction histidine kinase
MNTEQRSREIFDELKLRNYQRTDRVVAYLMVGQWAFGLLIAVVFSPYGWAGKVQVVHAHVYIALFLGGLITVFPVWLAINRSGEQTTRYVIVSAQMLWSALLIHLTGGRIETHFHIFGSLAFAAFYRDFKVLVPATVIVAVDHLARQTLWPESVYGITNPESWRFLEHAFWVAFEDVVLVFYCIVSVNEMRAIAEKQAAVEALSIVERKKSEALDHALKELQASHETLLRTEKLAAVGQLAASVGHELRNPLAAVRNANTYITRRVREGRFDDPRIAQFLDVTAREVGTCTRIISDLLDFARERPATLGPCPIRPLVDEAMTVVPRREKVELVNEVPESLPVPDLDREQFRQILVNLIQNAVEAIPGDREGRVAVRAEVSGEQGLRLSIEDDGLGMSREVVDRIFEPLFTTKQKGTGLGLAIVSNIAKRHNAQLRVESEVGRGTRFLIDLKTAAPAPVPAPPTATPAAVAS